MSQIGQLRGETTSVRTPTKVWMMVSTRLLEAGLMGDLYLGIVAKFLTEGISTEYGVPILRPLQSLPSNYGRVNVTVSCLDIPSAYPAHCLIDLTDYRLIEATAWHTQSQYIRVNSKRNKPRLARAVTMTLAQPCCCCRCSLL